MYYGGIGSIYDPSTYPEGVPNPYTPRMHAWGTREQNSWLAHGTRYHGPNYVRPMFAKPWQGRPLMGWFGLTANQFQASCPVFKDDEGVRTYTGEEIPAVIVEGSYICPNGVVPHFSCGQTPITAVADGAGWVPEKECDLAREQRIAKSNRLIAGTFALGLGVVGALGYGIYRWTRK